MVRPFALFVRQLRNPFLLLLAAASITSVALGERTDAIIILAIVALSVGLGFINEFRSEKAIADLHARVRRTALVMRDGAAVRIDVGEIVRDDVVILDVGDIVPADLCLVESSGLECDESLLTGESEPGEKSVGGPERASEAYMGTIVRNGAGRGVVTATGKETQLGKIASRLRRTLPETAFQRGLRDFSVLLVRVAMVLGTIVFVVNLALGHPLFEALLFTLAIVVGITPQLLPAIVTISLAAGARTMASRSVIVKRLITIEDFGNMEVLFTDKTGTLTEGRIVYASALDVRGAPAPELLRYGLLCNQAVLSGGSVVGGNALDCALWESSGSQGVSLESVRRLDTIPFDYERRVMSVLIDDGGRTLLVAKGAPESIVERAVRVPDGFHGVLDAQFAAGARVIALASKELPGRERIDPSDERDLELVGLLVFVDPPKMSAPHALERLGNLGITVKIITGDNERVAQKVCHDLGIAAGATLTGTQLKSMSDAELTAALEATSIFARIDPEQKARIIEAQRSFGVDVGFLGDGVNDAIALHDADVGISVDSAADVAKDAADIVLLNKDLDILADGVVEGRRVFANTVKYVLMGTSSNFGNMISAGIGSLFLTFLPMLPSQILLNNLLYDLSEMAIPTDNVDPEQLRRPAHWDMRLIRRFMLVFGPISSLFDLATFAVLLLVLHAGPSYFQGGFFAESFITQTLIVFAIRTRRVPFFLSHPSWQLGATTSVVAVVGVTLPFTPFGAVFGFSVLPLAFAVLVLALTITYFFLVEFAKTAFFRHVGIGVTNYRVERAKT